MASVDITIRGAGIFGLSIAWEALRQGARVRVIDPFGAGAGASGGVLGALAPHTPDNWNAKKAFQRDALLAGPDFWTAVEEVSAQPSGFRRSGRLQPLANDRAVELARTRLEAAATTWGSRACWSIVETPVDHPFLPLSPTGLFLHDDISALIHPRRAIRSLAAAIERLGGELRRDGREEGAVIHATGVAGLKALGSDLGAPFGSGIKGQAALLRLDAGQVAQVFADGIHIIPHRDGTLAVGSTSERDFVDPTSTDRHLNDLIAKARRRVPALAQAEIVERWAALRPRAPSRAPLLGPWPGRKGHFVANGGFKIGFGLAPGIARAMTDLVLSGQVTYPDEFALPDRKIS